MTHGLTNLKFGMIEVKGTAWGKTGNKMWSLSAADPVGPQSTCEILSHTVLKTRHFRSPLSFDLVFLFGTRWLNSLVRVCTLVNYKLGWYQPHHPVTFTLCEFSAAHIRPCYCITLLTLWLITLLNKLLPCRHMHICIWWCFQAEFKVRPLQITRKATTNYYRMTTGILTEDSELQPCLP